MNEVPAWQLFWPEDPPLADPFLRELVGSRPVQRLRRVGFLGAIDYLVHTNGCEPHRRRHNRFDHSVNVMLLALRYAVQRDLSDKQARVLTAAALLHDVGHGPLSHTLEPVFQRQFDINHHEAGRAIMSGTSPSGHAIPRVFSRHGVNLEEVMALLAGTHGGPHAYLFDSPVNLDTIEAITRCRYFSKGPQAVHPTDLVDAIATRDAFPIHLADRFWALKDAVYRTVILSHSGVAADILAQQHMTCTASTLCPDDFYCDDAQLRRRHPGLFVLFGHLRDRSLPADHPLTVCLQVDAELEAPTRCFSINTTASVSSPEDLPARYTQQKGKRRLSLGWLIGNGGMQRQLTADAKPELL